jgi:hypothetical protein
MSRSGLQFLATREHKGQPVYPMAQENVILFGCPFESPHLGGESPPARISM